MGGVNQDKMTESANKRVLILRPDHLGDLILFSGTLKHFRKLWPSAQITLSVHKFGLELFAHCPHVDNLISYEKLSGEVCGEGTLARRLRLHGEYALGAWLRRNIPGIVPRIYRSDIALLPRLAPSFDEHLCMELLPARQKIGISGNTTNQTVEIDLDSRKHYSSQMDASQLAWNCPELEVSGLFLSFLGATVSTPEIWPEFWTTSGDRAQANSLMPKTPDRITLAISPGFSNPAKELSATWFAEVISLLTFRNLRIVLLGSGADLAVCADVAKAIELMGLGIPILNLAGQTSVRQMIECVRQCDLVFSQDTATLHVATALRKPVAGILGGGHFGRFYPWGDRRLARVVHQPMDCYGCNWHCRHDTVRCIQEISPNMAAKELNELRTLV